MDPAAQKRQAVSRSKPAQQLIAIPQLERAVHAIAARLGTRPDLGVTQAEAHVLVFLHDRGAARVGEIHDAFGHRRSTLTSVLDRLEARRFLKRGRVPGDRRAVLISLSAAGERMADRVFAALLGWERDALRPVSDADLRTFERVLELFTQELRATAS